MVVWCLLGLLFVFVFCLLASLCLCWFVAGFGCAMIVCLDLMVKFFVGLVLVIWCYFVFAYCLCFFCTLELSVILFVLKCFTFALGC